MCIDAAAEAGLVFAITESAFQQQLHATADLARLSRACLSIWLGFPELAKLI